MTHQSAEHERRSQTTEATTRNHLRFHRPHLLKGSLGGQLGAWQWTLALVVALGLYLILGHALYGPDALRPLHFDISAHGGRYIRGAFVATISGIVLVIWTWPRWLRWPQFSLPTRRQLDTLRDWLNVHGSNGYSHLLMLCAVQARRACARGSAQLFHDRQGQCRQAWRTQPRRAARATFELAQPPFTAALINEMRAVSDDWLGEKGVEKGFSLGRFDLVNLERAPVALVRDSRHRLQAFASVLPSDGYRDEYSIDLMRHRGTAPSGTMDFLFVSLMQTAAAEGYAWFSLGMAPLAGVGDTPWANTAEQLARLAFEHGNRFFNYRGLRAFKDKWNPEWQSRYLAYPPQASLSRIQLDIIALVAGGYRRILGPR